MTEFLGDIAFMLEVLVLGVGLVILHFHHKDPSKYLNWAGKILTTFAVLGMLCTGYYYMRYWYTGSFRTAHHMGQGQSMMGDMMSGRGWRGHMMSPGMMENMKSHMDAEVSHCMSQMNMMDDDAKEQLRNCLVDRLNNN